jgi:mannosyl-oligosaccharide alpha-1,2-mannosidase
MIRRKARPLAIFAAVLVFLLFQFVRNGGTEVFTFDSLPPYTDTDTYIKKPTPVPVMPQEPPPPPPDWGTATTGGAAEHDSSRPPPIGHGEPQMPQLHDVEEPERPSRQDSQGHDDHSHEQGEQAIPPGRTQQQQQQQQQSQQNSAQAGHDDPAASNRFQQFSGDHEGHAHPIPDQPPVTGDHHLERPYTPEELAPRIQQYPLSPNEIIRLPADATRRLPTIQARFRPETTDQRLVRTQRLSAIKRAMTRSWDAYVTHAMGHDEVRPVTGRYNDPFCGWGATLVDSLDTLQIMGLEKEYREALAHLANIDFAHTRARQIPLFETVIRYLGGLLGAYDLSDGKDTILLDKARDLGDMLMGAFDTHNRMPLLRYNWRPRAASVGQRASEGSCLAELGTLTMEFTRLAQLTGNHSYYDAVFVLWG